MAVSRAAATAPARGAVAGQNQGPAGVSLRPSDAQQGGLVDDIDVDIKEAKFIEWDYNGNIASPVLGMELTLIDAEGKDYQQVFSAGDLKRLQPSEDGKRAIAVGGATGLNANSNAVAFLASLIDAGFPEEKFAEGDISVMEGANVHVLRKAQPTRKGIAAQNANGREATVLLVTKINRLPGEGKKGVARPTTTTTASKTASKPTPAESSDVETEAAETIIAMLEANGGEVTKSSVGAKSFKLLSKNPNRPAILKLMTDDDWLESSGESFGWTYDGKTIATA